jgi:3-oxoacyl-[acyl-carrier-protein] synthase-3
MNANVGIYGIGIYLPPIVRNNDWWPSEIIDTWRERQARSLSRFGAEPEALPTEGMRRAVAAMAGCKDDPFEGSKKRHILPDEMKSSDMEVRAGRDAIANAGIEAGQIDFVLAMSTTPNYLHASNAHLVHHELGLKRECLSISTEGMCNAFLQQLALAEALIRSDQARYGLLIQSSHISPFTRREDNFSAWFGDGAAATVVGAVGTDRGLLGHAHCTDGSLYGSLVSGIPGKRWYEEGRVFTYLESIPATRRTLLEIPDTADALVGRALERAHLQRGDIRLWACHQGAVWLGEVTQAHLGLDNARRVDTFAWAGSLSGANLPLILSVALRDGLLGDGDVVGMFAGASGMTASGMVMRWGR